MVLRVLLILFMITNFGHARKSGSSSSYLKAAQKRYAKKDYKGAVKILDKKYNLNKPATLPVPALNMLALIYQKTGNFEQSSKMFLLVLAKAYRKDHARTIKAFQVGKLDKVNPPDSMLRIYYYLGQNNYFLFSKKKQTPYYKAAVAYFTIISKKGHLDAKASRYLASLEEKQEYIKKLEKNWSWHVSGGWITWQESITLVEKADSSNKEKIFSTNSGYCFGGGFRYSNIRHGYNVHACAYDGTANLKESPGSSFQYRQNNVPVNGLYISTGYFYRPMDDNSTIGLSLPMFYREGQYVDTTTREIEGSGQLSAGGIALDAELEIYSDLSMYMNFANLGGTNLFLIQAKYGF